MYFLAIETTGSVGSVALARPDECGGSVEIVGYKACDRPMSHLSRLVPMIGEVLCDAGVDKRQVAFVAVSAGPGSFTGIRIGVSTARALCQGLGGFGASNEKEQGADAEALSGCGEWAFGTRAVSVNTLESFAHLDGVLALKGGEESLSEPVVCAIINARRGQVYGMVEGYLQAGPYMLTEVLDAVQAGPLSEGRRILFLGDGIDAYEVELERFVAAAEKGSCMIADKGIRYQDARAVARLGALLYGQGRSVELSELIPDYMRKAEAEQKLESGELPICRGPQQE